MTLKDSAGDGRITGIPHVSDVDSEEVNEILDGVEGKAPIAAD